MLGNKQTGNESKALLRLGYTCNNNCFFCHSHRTGADRTDLDTRECERRIELAAKAGAGMVVFSGGEPTIRKDILSLCRYAGFLGMKSGIITNGRMLSYQHFSDNLIEAGVRYALVSLHGDNEETHYRHAGTTSFEQTVSGLEAVSRKNIEIVVNTVITKVNADRLGRILDLIARFAPLKFKISIPEPRGAILSRMDQTLSPNEAARAVAMFLSSSDIPRDVSIGFDGFTPCLLENYFSLNDDFFTHGFSMVWYPDEGRFFPPDKGDRSYAYTCKLCSYYGRCPGIFTEYFIKYPETNLEPIIECSS